MLWDANWPVSNRIGHSCRCHGLLLRFSEDLVLSHHHWQCHCRHWCSCCWLLVFSLLLLCCVSVVTCFLLTNTSGPLPNPSRAELFLEAVKVFESETSKYRKRAKLFLEAVKV